MNELQKHIMVDIETMDTGPRAAVVAIGARIFTVDGPSKGFECFINPDTAALMGTVDAETMTWWKKQDAYEQVFSGKLDPADAAFRFRAFVDLHKPEVVWANSPEFDLVILQHMFKQTQMVWPFTYRQHADLRTLMRLGEALKIDTSAIWKNPDRKKHNALDDATKQAEAAAVVLKAILSNPAADSDPYSVPSPSVRRPRAPRPVATAPETSHLSSLPDSSR